jgi:hypothetical protein
MDRNFSAADVRSGLNPFSKDSGYGLHPLLNNTTRLFKSGPSGLTGIHNQYGVDTGSKNYAGDTYAALTREQWANYVSTFVPIENQLIQYATDPNKPMEAMAGASKDVNAAYTAQQGATDRQLKGLGVSLNADEQAAQTRSFGLSKSLADVGAQNVAGALTRDRQQSILGNPAPQSAQTGLQGG